MNQNMLMCGLGALAGVACNVAVARSVPGLDLQLSYDNVNWQENLAYTPGAPIYCRVVMTIPDSFYGITGAKYNIATPAGQWDRGGNDTVDLTPGKGKATDGRLAGFDFQNQTQMVYETNLRMRIDAKGDSGDNAFAGIDTTQGHPNLLGTKFNTAKTAEVYRFAMNITPETMLLNGGVVQIRIDDGLNATRDEIWVFRAYASQSSTAGTDIEGVRGDTADIYIPAPATLVALPLGVIALHRRRPVL